MPSVRSSSCWRAAVPFPWPRTASWRVTSSGSVPWSGLRMGARWSAPSAAVRPRAPGPSERSWPRSCSAVAPGRCSMPTPERGPVGEGHGAQRLAGVRVLVPRPRERAEPLCFLLEDEGAEVLAVPLLELEPPTDPRPLQAAAELLRRFSWVAFASERAVTALVEAARTAGTLDVLRTRKLAAVGPGTAAALGGLGLEASLVATVATGEGLAEALVPQLQPGDSVLLPAAEQGRRALEEALLAAGAAVERVVAYRSGVAGTTPAGWAEVVARPPRCVLFGSPRTVEAFLSLPGAGGLVGQVRAVAVGPTTAAALRARGWEPAAVAAAPTPPEWVEAAVKAIGG